MDKRTYSESGQPALSAKAPYLDPLAHDLSGHGSLAPTFQPASNTSRSVFPKYHAASPEEGRQARPTWYSAHVRLISTGLRTGERVSVPLGLRLRAHVKIARLDHVTKNVFVVPGILIPLSVDPGLATWGLLPRIALGFIAICLVACSNYVINEVLDAPFDRFHPQKHTRPVVMGLVNIPAAYAQWLLMMAAGLAAGALVSKPFVFTLLALWIMGCIYNFPPVRTKDLPYLDVISESVNNPLRMLLGWYMVAPLLIPPVSLLISYWMVGCYFMGLKRFAEFREINDPLRAASYRRSFAHYTEASLMVSVVFYASAAMLFFGAFIIRYRIELVLTFPLVALVMAIYLRLAYHPGSAVQNPEKLHRSRLLMGSVGLCFAAMLILLWVDIPFLATLFHPTLPTTATHRLR